MGTQNKDTVKKTENKANGRGDIIDDFIEDVWKVMTPEMVDRLRCILIDDMGFTKKDAEQFIQSQRDIRRKRICLKKDKRDVKIGPRNQWIKELSKDIADQMAMFVVGILLSNRTDRTKKLTEKILDHLCSITGEDTTLETAKTRVERTMVVIADRIATWADENISDIEQKLKEKYRTVEPIEAVVPKESTSTLSSVTTESIDSMSESLIVSEDHLFSESDISEMKSEISSSIRSSVSLDEKSMENIEETSEEEKEEDGSEREESEMEESQEEELDKEESTKEESDVEETEQDESEQNEETTADETDLDKDDIEGEAKEEESDVEIEEVVEEETTENEETEEEDDKKEKQDDEVYVKKSEIEETMDFEGKYDEFEEEKVSDIKESIPEKISKDTRQLPVDLLDLLKEDVTRLPNEGEKSDRQKAVKDIIDKRFEEIVKEKLQKSLDSLIKYDIEEAASIVANWVDDILASVDVLPKLSRTLSDTKSAFEIKLGDGSEFAILRLSSTTVADRIAVTKGMDPPIRKMKLPRSMSPLNEKSTKDWADWALGAVNVGNEWGNWLDNLLSDAEQQLSEQKPSWKDWKDAKEKEAQKWRAEQQRIKNEGSLWNRKLNTNVLSPEQETKVLNY